jgi:hypothetical protein
MQVRENSGGGITEMGFEMFFSNSMLSGADGRRRFPDGATTTSSK